MAGVPRKTIPGSNSNYVNRNIDELDFAIIFSHDKWCDNEARDKNEFFQSFLDPNIDELDFAIIFSIGVMC